MRSRTRILTGLLALQTLCLCLAEAQGIRGVTRRVITSPAPGVSVSAVPQSPPSAPPPPPPQLVAVPAQPRFVSPPEDKAQVEKRTIEFQKKRAAEGRAFAQFDLGIRYLRGDGVEKDIVTGRKWLHEAAKNGHERAAKKLQELERKDKDEKFRPK